MTVDRFLIAGGGTSGHVNPALAVAEQLIADNPRAEIIFAVTEDGIERGLIEEAGYPHHIIRATRFPDKSPRSIFHFIKETLSGYRTGRKMIKRYRPKAVLGTGGFVCAPLMLAAALSRVPYVLHEQNAFPGKSNRFFAGKAKAVCVSFPGTDKHWSKKARLVETGNPVKRVFFTRSRREARQILGIGEDEFVISVMGGSLGAKSINETLTEFIKRGYWQILKSDYPQIRLAVGTGIRNSGEYLEVLKDAEGIDADTYIDAEAWIPASDLFIGRAGASACMECAAVGLPSIFVPFPLAANDHQTANAAQFVEEGASLMIKDDELNAQALYEAVKVFLKDKSKRDTMAAAAKRLAKPDAAEDIAAILNSDGKRYE